MTRLLAATLIALILAGFAIGANAQPPSELVRAEERLVTAELTVRHLRAVLRVRTVERDRARTQRTKYRRGWLKRGRIIRQLRAQLRPGTATHGLSYWIAKQIRAANIIGRESAGDPWPNCPDPYDGSGASWYDTVRCENGGNWLDSPGYYRCGLQFDPMWERRFGLLCPR